MDGEDIRLLDWLMDNPDKTTSEVARGLYDPQTTIEMRLKDNKIRYRMEKLESLGLVKRTKSQGKQRFLVPLEKMRMDEAKIVIEDEEISLGRAILITNGEVNHAILLDSGL